MKRTIILLNVLLIAITSLAQSAGGPKFDVATIKPTPTNEPRSVIGTKPGGEFNSANTTLKDLIEFAYSIKSGDEIVGATGWMASDKFTVDAKADETQAAALQKMSVEQRQAQVGLMLQALLEDRFKLKVTHANKEIPVYNLEIAKGGAKLKASEMVPGDEKNPAPHPVKGPFVQMGNGKLSAEGVSMAFTAVVLSGERDLGASGPFGAGRLIVDKTGLTGAYDWTLTWTPESPDPMMPRAAATDANGAGLFTSLQEQLGLKLEPGKGTADVMTVVSAERPTEN